MPRIVIPAQCLQQRLAQHASQLGAIASAGEWPLPWFRRIVVPTIVAIMRRIDGLPSPIPTGNESGMAWALSLALQAIRALESAPGLRREDLVRRQVRALAAALVAGSARIDEQWMAVGPEGRRMGGGAEPLSACVLRLGLSRYHAQPRPSGHGSRADRTESAFAWLIRDLPPHVIGNLAGDGGDDLPAVLARARELREVPVIPRCAETAAMAELVRSGCWRVNRRKGRLWWIDRRLFLVWRTGAREIARHCGTADEIESAADTLLPRLQSMGIVRGGVHARSTPWTTGIDVVELNDPAEWLALAACADAPATNGPASALAPPR